MTLSSEAFSAALSYAWEKLAAFAQQSEIEPLLTNIFGESYDSTVATTILQSWANSDFSTLPEIRILDAASMPGILGGYADNIVYLNADFLANASSEQLGAILLEEFGHWLDSQINTTDAAGDEGELFANQVLGIALATEQSTLLQMENDTATITVDEQAVVIETAITAAQITSISDDTGILGDFRTTDQTLIINGTYARTSGGALYLWITNSDGISTNLTPGGISGIPNPPGSSTVSGTWSFDYSSTVLAAGNYIFTLNTSNGNISNGVLHTRSVQIAQLNSAPVNTMPGSQVVAEDAVLTFTGGNVISVNDIDGNLVRTTLTVTNGTLTVNLMGGATITSGSNNSSTLTLSGTQAQINTALGTLAYRGNLNYNGSDTLTVVSTDGAGTPLSDTDTVIITVTPVNDAPIVANGIGAQNGVEDTAVNFTIPANTFSDVDDVSLSLSATLGNGSPLPAWLSFNATTRTFSGTPPQDFNGTLILRVTATDAAGLSASSTFNLAIAAVNDAPIVADAIGTQNGTEDTAVNFTIPANTFTDVDDATLSLSATLANGDSLPAWLSFNATTQTFSGTPPQDFNGTLILRVTATDAAGLSASSTFNLAIAPVNDAPVLTGIPAILTDGTEDTAYTISATTLLQGYTDVDSAVLSVSNLTATNGTLVNNGNGTWTFTPNPNFNGTVDLSYSVVDGNGGSVAATRAFAIAPVNDAPVLTLPNPVAFADTANDDNFVPVSGTLSATDPDAGQTLTYGISGAISDNSLSGFNLSRSSSYGTLYLNSSTGAYRFVPNDTAIEALKANISELFTVTVNDGNGDSDSKTLTINLTGANDTASIIGSGTGSVTEDANSSTLTASGSLSVSDRDAGDARFSTTVTPVGSVLGNLTITEQGAWSYSIDNSAVQYLGQNETRVEKFAVRAIDGTAIRDIEITITGVNDAAVIGTPTVTSVTEDSAAPTLTATGSISITDADQGQASFKTSVVGSNTNLGSLVIAANGTYIYSVANSAVQYLGAGDTRTETFTVEALDGTTQQVSFTITGVNDAAVIGNPTVTGVTEDSATPTLTATGSISITDADQGEASFQTIVTGSNANLGNLVLAADGSYTYSVANSAVQFLGAGDIKTETFTIESADGTTRQVSFTITGVNDAAVIGAPTVTGVTEDAASTLTATGSISITDADQGEASFKTTVTGSNSNLGTLSLQPNGSYTYSVANSAVQFLGAGQTKIETFTVEALDGTTQQVSFTITGVNDVASITGAATAFIKEDTNVANGQLMVNGQLTVSDVDQGDAFFDTVVSFKNNSLNSAALGALTINTAGNYSYSVNNSNPQVQSLRVGQTITETFAVRSKDGTATQDITISIQGTNDGPIAAAPSRLTQSTQYSDAIQDVIFTATDIDAGDILTGSIAYSYNGGAFVDGLPDAGSVAGGLRFAYDATSGSWQLNGIADLATGTYRFRFRATDSQGAVSDTFTTLTVNHENAQTLFDGQTFVSSDSSGNARVTLRSVIQDISVLGLDPTGGNISRATVQFVNRATGAIIASNVPVTLVQQGSQLVGIATFDWNTSIGNADSDTLTIGTVVEGGFYRQNSSLEDTTITISRPTGQFISGGGYTVLSNSAGLYAGDANSRFNYGFNIKTARSQNSYQGKFTGIFRRRDAGADGLTGTADDVMRTYQIRSNAADSLVVQTGVNLDNNTTTREDGVAVFRSKANLVDVTNPLAPVSLGGNLQLEVSMQDWGEPGMSDRINVRLWNSAGSQLLYSNISTMGSINPLNSSQQQLIGGGNIDIH